MSNNKQNSVEWLISQITEDQMAKAKSIHEWISIFEQAKAMHKEEIERAHYEGSVIVMSKPDDDMLQLAEQYYNETYGGNK